MTNPRQLLCAAVLTLAVFTAGCGSGSSEATTSTTTDPVATEAPADQAAVSTPTSAATATPTTVEQADDGSGDSAASSPALAVSCDEVAARFVTKGSANPDLADPMVAATCEGDVVTIVANGIPDYTYIQTSPGNPGEQDLTLTIPATPTMAGETTAVPPLGSMAVAINGVPIYGPTEGQGGDVLSLVGALSECGSHNGPTGFHMHLLGTSETTDCLYSPDEVASGPQLIGYAFDGYPIYTGNGVHTSSWELTDASLFATDTWSAHSYVEGSGDLDECNGLVDENGDYAYYTTDTFPYIMGCYRGVVDVDTARGAPGGGAGGGAAPGGGVAPGGGAGGGAAPGGGAPPGAAAADLTDAAATLGVTVAQLEAALGAPPPDLDAAAAALGVTIEQLQAVLPGPQRGSG